MTASSAAEGGDLRWRMYSLGNSWSLSVDRDLAIVSFTVPSEGAEEALRTVAAMVADSTLPAPAIAEARGALLAHVRSARERLSTFAGEAFRGALYEGRPYAAEPNGRAEGLARLEYRHLRLFRSDRFLEGPRWVALVGDIAPRRARELAAILAPPEEPRPITEAPKPQDPPTRRELSLSHPSGRAYIVTGARAPRVGDPLEAEASVLQLALGWQVFRHFTKDESSAYEAGAFYDALAEDGDFGLYAGVAPARAGEATAAIDSIVSAARDRVLPADLVAAAREAFLGGTAIASAKSVNVAIRLARRAALGAPFDDLRRRVATLTAEDLHAAAAKMLAEDGLLRLRVGP
jgi:predicted Zn-dependent peptidase